MRIYMDVDIVSTLPGYWKAGLSRAKCFTWNSNKEREEEQKAGIKEIGNRNENK